MRMLIVFSITLTGCIEQLPQEPTAPAAWERRSQGALYETASQLDAGEIISAKEYLERQGLTDLSESMMASLAQGDISILGESVSRPVRVHQHLVVMPPGVNENIEAYADQFEEQGMDRQLRWFEALVYFRAYDPTNRVHAFLYGAYLRDRELLGTQALTVLANEATVGRCHQCLVSCSFVVSPQSITEDRPTAGFARVGEACTGTGYAYSNEQRSTAGCGGMGVARNGSVSAIAGNSCRRSVSPALRCAFAEDGAGACGQVSVQVGGTSHANSLLQSRAYSTTLPLLGNQNANAQSKVTLRLPDFSGGTNYSQEDKSKAAIGGSAISCSTQAPTVSCNLTFGVNMGGLELPGCSIGLGLACELDSGRFWSDGVAHSRFAGHYNTVATFQTFTIGQPLHNLGTPEVKTEHSVYTERADNNGLGTARTRAFGQVTLELSRAHVLENPQNVRIVGPELNPSSTVKVTCGSPINRRVEFPEEVDPPVFPQDLRTACKSDLDCDDGRACTIDRCDMMACGCIYDETNCDPVPCEADDDCAEGEICMAGACTPPTECSDENPCQDGGTCIDGICAPGPLEECGDGLPECPDGLVCMTGACAPPNECSEENPCQDGGTCIDGVCTPGPLEQCGDGLPPCPEETPCCMAGGCMPMPPGMGVCP